jgi:hypothetical protein
MLFRNVPSPAFLRHEALVPCLLFDLGALLRALVFRVVSGNLRYESIKLAFRHLSYRPTHF